MSDRRDLPAGAASSSGAPRCRVREELGRLVLSIDGHDRLVLPPEMVQRSRPGRARPAGAPGGRTGPASP